MKKVYQIHRWMQKYTGKITEFANLKTERPGCLPEENSEDIFLDTRTEEIEEPKKEVEKVVEVRKIADISDVKDIKNLDYWQVVVPCQAIPEDVYDITVHYKIKE